MFKVGDKVVKKSKELFENSKYEAVVDKIVGNRVWFEHGSWLLESELELLPQEDPLTEPKHYHKGGIDVIGFLLDHFPKEGNYTVAEAFFIGNIIKYVCRYKDKNGMEDLLKAQDYINRLIEVVESER